MRTITHRFEYKKDNIGYSVVSLDYPGVISQGNTLAEMHYNAGEAFTLYCEACIIDLGFEPETKKHKARLKKNEFEITIDLDTYEVIDSPLYRMDSAKLQQLRNAKSM
jgi:predicted RNase H-like HicB family nuclease